MADADIDLSPEETVGLVDVEDRDPLKCGFTWWKAPVTLNEQHTSCRRLWTISGHDMQILTSTVPSGHEVVTEVGSFMFMHPGMTTESELTLCSKGGCGEGCNRIMSGESCVKLILRNDTGEEGYVGLTPNFPAKVVPVVFGETVQSNSAIFAQGGAIMSQFGGVDVGCDMDCTCSSCCALGLCRQKITGDRESMAFLAAGGTVVYKSLQNGETVIVDKNSVVAIEDSVEIGCVQNGRFCMCCLGGEGCFSVTLTGPGKVWMQSMNFSKFQAAVQQTVYEEMDRDDGDND